MTPPTGPLAELQAQHELHIKRHDMVRGHCDTECCPTARWLSLRDRLAEALEAVEMTVPHNELDTLATLGRVAEERDRALEQRDAAEAGAAELKERLNAAYIQRDAAWVEEAGLRAQRDQALSLVADNNHAWAAKLADSERDRAKATAALANVKEEADDVLAELGKCPDYETAMVAASKLCGTLQFISQHVAALLVDSERQRDKAAAQRDRLATDALTARDYWKHVFGTTEGD